MFGIGIMEFAIIGVVILLFVGPNRLPEVARDAGKFFVKLRRITNDVRSTVDGFIKQAEAEVLADERKKLKSLIESELGSARSWIDEHNERHDAHHATTEPLPDHTVSHDTNEPLPDAEAASDEKTGAQQPASPGS